MENDILNSIVNEYIETFTEKFLFIFEKPDFSIWFVGRIHSQHRDQFSREEIKKALDEHIIKHKGAN